MDLGLLAKFFKNEETVYLSWVPRFSRYFYMHEKSICHYCGSMQNTVFGLATNKLRQYGVFKTFFTSENQSEMRNDSSLVKIHFSSLIGGKGCFNSHLWPSDWGKRSSH